VMQRIFENKNLRNHIHVFRDRSAGGHALAELLREHREDSAVLLAIPSGGVPVALAIATDLSLPLDFMIVSKITFSWNTEGDMVLWLMMELTSSMKTSSECFG
jgi:putative phosphoribosyl transferase